MLGVTLFGFSFFILATAYSNLLQCACSRKELCEKNKSVYSPDPQVYIFSRKTTDIHLWAWKTINTLVAPSSFSKDNALEAETLCFTRQQGKRYGITVEFEEISISGSKNLTEFQEGMKRWRTITTLKQQIWQADVLTIDLLPFFRSEKGTDKDHLQMLAGELLKLQRHNKDTEIICIVPWKPPCADDGTCEFTFNIRDACTYFVINAESFLDTKTSKCVARANIPFSKLVYGISEYITKFVPPDRLILGVSWHGFDYACTSLVNNICHMETPPINGSSSDNPLPCLSFMRKRLTHGDIIRYHSLEYTQHQHNKLHNAPFFNYKNGSVNHQVWFENHDSLKYKYRLAHELQLRGIAILYGDDLSPTTLPNLQYNEKLMWSWLAHEVLLSATKKPEHHDLHWPDTVAGVAVGCLILGVILGVIFTCIGLQKRVRKPRQSMRDMDPLGMDYTDDPDL